MYARRRALVCRLDDRVLERLRHCERAFPTLPEEPLAVAHVRDVAVRQVEDFGTNLGTDAIADATSLIDPYAHVRDPGASRVSRRQGVGEGSTKPRPHERATSSRGVLGPSALA